MDEKTSYKFSNGTVECADVQNLHTVLDDPQVFYLLDNMKPAIPCHACKVVMFSPNREHCKDYKKGRTVDTRIIPVWELEELETLHHDLYPEIDAVKMKNLYALWGGIPWYVVEKVKIKSSQKLLEEAMYMATANFDKLCFEKVKSFLIGSEGQS
ncbi:1519_t:CDS:2, partial [Paraglomus brasilianum]